METISLLNTKGGVSKSVSAASIASLLSKDDYKILLIDLDPQANLSSLFREESKKPIGELLKQEYVDEKELSSYFIDTYDDNIKIIPGDDSLTDVIYVLYDQSKEKDINYRLRDLLSAVKNNFDYVIIDNSPFYTYLTKLSLYASDLVLAPIEMDNFSYDGLIALLNRIIEVNRTSYYDTRFKVFFTKVNSRTILFRSLQKQYREILGDIFCSTYIRNDNSVREASTVYFPVPDYAPKCNATNDYLSLLSEVLNLDRWSIRRIESKLNKVRRQI